MHSFTVYEFGSREFRVVLGDHVAHANAGASNVRVYQGSDAQSAVLAAIAAETRSDIKSQIKRFLSPEIARKVEQNTAYGPFIVPDSAPRNASDAGADSAAAATNSGGVTLPKVRAFNTGRLYTEHGQRIAWAVLDTERVAMVDLDRMIEYVLTLHSVADLAPLRDSDVLKAYDTHNGSMRGVWDADFQAIKSALYAAARECASVKS